MAGIVGEMVDEIVGDLGLALEAQEGFGPACIAAAILGRGAFEDDDTGARLGGGDGCG
ncbi:MAG: hypothetical protein R3D67_06525 [Hyphomicrobiaceae bacterium]